MVQNDGMGQSGHGKVSEIIFENHRFEKCVIENQEFQLAVEKTALQIKG